MTAVGVEGVVAARHRQADRAVALQGELDAEAARHHVGDAQVGVFALAVGDDLQPRARAAGISAAAPGSSEQSTTVSPMRSTKRAKLS